MLDNQLIQVFLPIITTGLTNAGFTGVTVKQANQPTQQGINLTAPAIYFYKIGDHRYGHVYREDVWDPISSSMVYTETQQYETTFQISALVLQDPTNINAYTASDLVNTVAQIMQSASTIQTLVSNAIGLLRVMDVRNPYFVDDRDQFEASPSFDFILTHEQTSTIVDPVIDFTVVNINRV
jgi:hypothetical protein